MKKVITLLVFAAFVSCNAKRTDEQVDTAVSLLRDVTDEHRLSPDPTAVLRLFDIAGNKRKVVKFRYREITDQINVPLVEVDLNGSRKNGHNEPLFYEKRILCFYDTVKKIIQYGTTQADSLILPNSECLRSISQELQYLSRLNARRKILLLYCNAFENSDIFSIYRKENRSLLFQNPDSIQRLFCSKVSFPDNASGIEVYFLFHARKGNSEEDRNFIAVTFIIKRIIEQRQGIVKIQANL